MINVPTACLLAQYKRWADQVFFDSLASLPPEELSKERVCVLKSMIATLNHIYVVDRIWQAHLEHRQHGFKSRNELPYPALTDLRQAQREVDDWFVAWSARQTDESLDEAIDFAFVSGNQGRMTAGTMLLHAVNHATYHRGWLVQMYFEIPAMPPMTDLCVFLTEARPDAASPC